MYARVSKSMSRVLALAFVALMPIALAAQGSAKPAAKATTVDPASKWDIFLGYSYLAPKGKAVNGFTYNAINYGAIASVSRYFNKNIGIQGEGDEHILLPENGVVTTTQPNDDFSGGSLGIIFRYPTADFTPFAHALIGADLVGSYSQPKTWGMTETVGGGMDYSTPLFGGHLAIRLFQADFQHNNESFAPGESGNFKLLRLSAGLVYRVGGFTPPPPVTLACSANPASIFPGDPVTVTATAGNLDPKLNADLFLVGNRRDGQRNNGLCGHRFAGGRHLYGEGRSEGRQARQGRPEARPDRRLLGQLYGEGLRAADHQLLGQPQHHQAGRHEHRHRYRHEPAEPSADL